MLRRTGYQFGDYVTQFITSRTDCASLSRGKFYSDIIAHLRNPTTSSMKKLTTPTKMHKERYVLDGPLLTCTSDKSDPAGVVIPADDDLRAQLVHEHHDTPISGHLGCEKTFGALARNFFWPRMYKWVRKWVQSCETCQRVKPSPSSQAALRPLPIPADVWRSVSMDFIFGLPPTDQGHTGVLVLVDRFSKMVHFAPVPAQVTAEQTATIFLDTVFRHHEFPESIVSDRDPRFRSAF